MKNKSFILVVLAIVLCVPLFAGGQKESQKGTAVPTIRFLSSFNVDQANLVGRGVTIRRILDNSKEWAKIDYEGVSGGDDVFTKIQIEAAADNLPDVFTYWPGSRLNVLIGGNLIADMTDYVNQSEVISFDLMDKSIWDLFRWEDVLGGVPSKAIFGSFFVNREMFQKYGLSYPKTYEDMVRAGKVFRQNAIIPFAMASFEGNPSHFWFTIVQFQFKSGLQDVLDMDKTFQFDTPRSRETAKLMVRMKEDGLYPKDTLSNGQWGPCTALYAEKKAAMIFTYPFAYGKLNKQMNSVTDIIDVPRMPGGTVDPHSVTNYEANSGIIVSRKGWEDKSKNSAIRKILDMFCSKEGFYEREGGGEVPTRTDVPLDDLPELVSRALEFQSDSGKYPSHFHKTVYNPAVVEFQMALDELFAGNITADQYVDQVQAVFDEGKAAKKQ